MYHAGRAEVSHTAAADKFGLEHELTIELSSVYIEGLDAKGDSQRHGQVMARARKQIGPRPTWMRRHREVQGEDAGTIYTWAGSTSVLALLDTCPLGRDLQMRGSGLHYDPHLLPQLFEQELGDVWLKEIKAKWKKRHKSYRTEYKQLKARQDRGGGGDDHERAETYFAILVR